MHYKVDNNSGPRDLHRSSQSCSGQSTHGTLVMEKVKKDLKEKKEKVEEKANRKERKKEVVEVRRGQVEIHISSPVTLGRLGPAFALAPPILRAPPFGPSQHPCHWWGWRHTTSLTAAPSPGSHRRRRMEPRRKKKKLLRTERRRMKGKKKMRKKKKMTTKGPR
ncbi:parathymosin [Suricata suricatta]|uniref:parathymosin n=1 Tax=Suricata suricatta TaxID=37032 RepID=UPI001156019B|nr:parathymosin [Suricata suricatta]